MLSCPRDELAQWRPIPRAAAVPRATCDCDIHTRMTNRRQEFGQGFWGMLEISIHHPDHISLGGLPSFHYCRSQAVATRASQHANWQFATQFFCYIGSAIRTGI